jgi:hypothetical protein
MNNKARHKIVWKDVVFKFLFITLIFSIIYAVARIFASPSEAFNGISHAKLKSDYVLMLIQCILGLIVMFIPSIIERRWSIDIPNVMEIIYFIFLYCAIYLGEVRNFYYLIPNWDVILHALSGGMLGAMGYTIVSILNETEKIKINLSPVFVALFAFCFALAAGAVWEIYEFTFDGLLSLNMQKFALEDGTLLVGRKALEDTMTDIIVDALSALTVVIAGYLSIKKGKK